MLGLDLATRQAPQLATLILLACCLIGILILIRRRRFTLLQAVGGILALVNSILFYVYVLFLRGTVLQVDFDLSTNWSAFRSLHAAMTLATYIWFWIRYDDA